MCRSSSLRTPTITILLVAILYFLVYSNNISYRNRVLKERESNYAYPAQARGGTSNTLSSPSAGTIAGRTLPTATTVQAYAYVFYATAPEYACSALVNIARLQSFHTPHRIVVLAAPSLSSTFLVAFTSRNATVVPYEPPRHPTDNVPYYHDVLLKLVGFKLHHYIPSLSRVLILDADQFVLQSLDHVFDLPSVDVAMPHAYWLGSGMTSAFILVSLSDRLWKQMDGELRKIGVGIFDMDLVNHMFSRTALMLPGDYCTINSHWETNDVPAWYRDEEPPRDLKWQPLPFVQLEPPLNSTVLANMSKEERESYERKIQQQRDEHFEQQEIAERKTRIGALLERVYGDSKVLHFTAVGKPWQYTPDDVRAKRPNAHSLLATQFATWQGEALEVCPKQTWET